MTQPFASTEYGDQYTRVTSRTKPGFLERLSETAGGMVVGLGLFALYFYVLFTNEVRPEYMRVLEEQNEKSC